VPPRFRCVSQRHAHLRRGGREIQRRCPLSNGLKRH
jgi:hypothetical protein